MRNTDYKVICTFKKKKYKSEAIVVRERKTPRS